MTVTTTPAPGQVQECRHTRVHHEHGTIGRARGDGCRCALCATAQWRYDKARKAAAANGTGRRLLDPEAAAPARAHVRHLHHTLGVSLNGLAEMSGASMPAIVELLRGERMIRSDVAARLLRVRFEDAPDRCEVSPRGAMRRVQALACMGYTPRRVAHLAGLSVGDLVNDIALGRKTAVFMGTHRAIDAVYRRLWDVPAPTGTREERLSRTRALNRAAANGWAPPAAWDDIDRDPAPKGVARDHA